jgi:Na+/proline symporter
MFLAGYMVIHLLPDGIGFSEALHLAGKSGKVNVITSGIKENGEFDWKDKYNLWSGIIGGFFLAMSYFGTDQSQVGRYLTARNLKESRSGLLMNGFVKVPMQFLILLTGVLVFSFYTIYDAPVSFNDHLAEKTRKSKLAGEFQSAETSFYSVKAKQKEAALAWINADKNGQTEAATQWSDSLKVFEKQAVQCRQEATSIIRKANPGADANDTNYIFLHFVVHHLPKGLVGLLIAIIFLAAWGSIAAALNSLAGSTIIDWHHLLRPKDRSDNHHLYLSRFYTLIWGIFCVAIAQLAGHMGSLIEAVNVLGSLFYGTILGIFCCALFLRKTTGKAVFFSAIITEALVIYLFLSDTVSFLWLNLIGCGLLCMLALLISVSTAKNEQNH